jgi:hypothetical protein
VFVRSIVGGDASLRAATWLRIKVLATSHALEQCSYQRARRTILVFLFPSVLSIVGAAAKDEFQYNPAACKTDAKEHLYIALGRHVLAVPFLKRSTYVLDPVLPKARRPAPDPLEREGCPGNPSQQNSFAFKFGSPIVDLTNSDSNSMGIGIPTSVTLYEASRPPSWKGAYQWPGEDDGLAKLMCAKAAIREELPNGLMACRVRPNTESRLEDWGTSYVAKPSIYTTPLGRRFTVDCGPGLYSGPPISKCRVGYAISMDLAVSYEFQPYLGPSPIPIDRIVEVDRNIRAQIDAAIVKEFFWPDHGEEN